MLNTIEIFPWNHNFETGIAEVDAQHRRLVPCSTRWSAISPCRLTRRP
jgi:hemerythrin